MKPPYKIPTMTEINNLPWNGYKVASTFSGCGGSSLGYKMAGYKVVWANEFIPAAQDTYRANHSGTHLNTDDIRKVTPEIVLKESGLQIGELDIFDGSPPCASFSVSGKREAGWGKKKSYSDTTQRTDDLFFEYARLLKGLQPKVFIAENVAGLIKGTAKGYFLEILQALRDCGYNVKAKVLDAQWLGVPQARQRLIFIGVRSDLGIEPSHPKPLDYFYTIKEAWDGLAGTEERKRLSPEMEKWYKVVSQGDSLRDGSMALNQKNSGFNWYRLRWDRPSRAITATNIQACHPDIPASLTINECKRVCAFPDDFLLTGTFAYQWERLGRAVPPLMMKAIAETVKTEILDRVKND